MQNAIIKGGESLSSAISLWNTRHFALDIPEDFTGTSISFQGGGADFVTRNIYDSAGAELTATVAPGTMCSLSGVAAALAPYRSLRIRSGTAASPTVQLGAYEGAERYAAFATRILANAQEAEQATLAIIGKQQGLEVRARLATTPEQLENIVW